MTSVQPDRTTTTTTTGCLDHPVPTIGGTPGAHWIACDCGWLVMGKPSVRAARRSFKHHRQNQYAKAGHGG